MPSNWVLRSEQNLLNAHNSIASKVKFIKRIFIPKGKMMKIFDNINTLHNNNDYDGIENIYNILTKNLPVRHSPRFHKYQELINYTAFLFDYRNTNDYNERIMLAHYLIQKLNVSHELGYLIKNRVCELVKSVV